MVDSRQVYVKPEWSKSLTPFCTQLTGITNETLANAGTLRDAVQQFDSYVYTSFITSNKSFCLITDGSWDLKYCLRAEAAAKGIKLAAHYSRFFDLRNEFQLHKNAPHATNLNAMLEYLGLTMEGRHHSGISDCMNISKIVARLIKDGMWYD
jgi:inhibitor of KinA sporulation pathway (predicted exonuclease)